MCFWCKLCNRTFYSN
ncbi:hypothetical protein [uncultured Fusobacterium sp.]